MTEQQTLAEVLADEVLWPPNGDGATRLQTAALAWFDALLSGPAAVEVVDQALGKHRSQAATFCTRPCRWTPDDVDNDRVEHQTHRAAAALTALRALVADVQNPPQTDRTGPRSDEHGSPRGLGRSDGVREAREGL